MSITCRSGLRVCLTLSLVQLAAACADDTASAPQSVDGVVVPDGFSVHVVTEGLAFPTQITSAGDDQLLVAQLSGGENDSSGTVVAVSLADDAPGEPTTLLEGIDKPTGVATDGESIWVMTPTALLRSDSAGGELSSVADDLPNNGRSQGSLTLLDDGTLLFNTSGRLDGDAAFPGSGNLYALDTTDPGAQPEVLATGFKNAYAHVVDAEGQLWVTEIGDGRYDGNAPLDELAAVNPGDDFGWPTCIDDGKPVVEHGGTAESCAAAPHSHALFDAGATPVAVAVAPWDDDVLLVALWVERRIVSVPRQADGDAAHEGETFMTGVTPQSLLVDGQRLLVVDFAAGRILAVSATER